MQNKLIMISMLCLVHNMLMAKEARDTSYLPLAYYDTFKEDLPIYSGRLFMGYDPKIKGSPYIPIENWETGSVMYNNIWYKIATLKYDASTDDLVIQTPSRFSVTPVSYRVQSFLLGDRNFVRIDSLKNISANGFYEILHEGVLTVLAKRKRSLEQKIEQMDLEREFIVVDEFYIKTNNGLKKIVSKKDLFEVVKDKKALVKKTLRAQRLRFRKNRETLILTAVETYNKN